MRNFYAATLHALQELVQATRLDYPSQLSAHHIVRRLTDTEVRLLTNLIMRVEPGALLGPLDDQNNVFRQYRPQANAHSFRAAAVPVVKPVAETVPA